MSDTLLWIPAGRRFLPDDITFWQGKGLVPLADRLSQIDTIVFGPHASAAFPEELRPFIAPGLTRRKQCDFSDVLTAPLAQAWAATDPHVLYIENPHARVVMDPNRAPVEDIVPPLRAFFEKLVQQQAGEKVSYAGIDAIRPVTFSGEPVLRAPGDAAEWARLEAALQGAADLGPRTYIRVRDQLVEAVLAARKGRGLLLMSLHDTMNTQMQPDGAILRERAPADRLPALANLGNLGDTRGEGDSTSMPGARARALCAAWAEAWGLAEGGQPEITLNSPYKGAQETRYWGERLRPLGLPDTGIVQVEFLREVLLGPTALAQLHQPGHDWPAPDMAVITALAEKLADARRRYVSTP